jgi:hypothetical protein
MEYVVSLSGTNLASLTAGREIMEQRFWSKVDIREPSVCWPWKAARYYNGYGAYSVRTEGGWRNVGAHRFAYEERHGAVPDGLIVCHSCDNPGCCNPTHLFLGTHGSNAQDKMQKGRDNTPRGSRAGRSTTTEWQAIGIMARLLTGREDQSQVAAGLSVTQAVVSKVWCGRTWSHLFNPDLWTMS